MNDKIFLLLIERYFYTARTSIGRLYFQYAQNFVQFPLVIGKEYFCFTLEDTVRPSNIKVYGNTCLPGGLECSVGLFENDHYKKTIIFYTETDKETILVPPLKWAGCLAHNGIDYSQTEGCVLVGSKLYPAMTPDKEPTILTGMKDALRLRVDKALKEGYTIKAKFVNLNQLT